MIQGQDKLRVNKWKGAPISHFACEVMSSELATATQGSDLQGMTAVSMQMAVQFSGMVKKQIKCYEKE